MHLFPKTIVAERGNQQERRFQVLGKHLDDHLLIEARMLLVTSGLQQLMLDLIFAWPDMQRCNVSVCFQQRKLQIVLASLDSLAVWKVDRLNKLLDLRYLGRRLRHERRCWCHTYNKSGAVSATTGLCAVAGARSSESSLLSDMLK